nr:polysaccharide deacetylase family protein [Alphaproteobacteria bacterium]
MRYAVVILVSTVTIVFGAVTRAAADTSLLDACWSKDELTSKPSERRPKHSSRSPHQPVSEIDLAPVEPLPADSYGAVRRVTLPKGKKWIALTLDLCEQRGEVAGYDGAIFDYLRQENIAATVFSGGRWMRSHPNRTLQLVADPRFELANHSEAHRNLRRLTGKALAREIIGPQLAYETLRSKL